MWPATTDQNVLVDILPYLHYQLRKLHNTPYLNLVQNLKGMDEYNSFMERWNQYIDHIGRGAT